MSARARTVVAGSGPPDTAFAREVAELGFEWAGSARRPVWKATLAGRRWTLSSLRDRRTRYSGDVRSSQTLGWRLHLGVSTELQTLLFLVPSGIADGRLARWIYRLRRQEVVELPEPLSDLRLVTLDVAWAKRLAADPETLGAIVDLSHGEIEASRAGGSVYFGDRSLYFATDRLARAPTAPQVEDWIDRLGRLIETVEAHGPPAVQRTPNWLDRLAERDPWLGFAVPTAMLGCAVIALGVLLSGGLLAVSLLVAALA